MKNERPLAAERWSPTPPESVVPPFTGGQKGLSRNKVKVALGELNKRLNPLNILDLSNPDSGRVTKTEPGSAEKGSRFLISR
jgi:hypothetical protein